MERLKSIAYILGNYPDMSFVIEKMKKDE